MRKLLSILALLALTLPTAANSNEDEAAPDYKPLVMVNSNTTDPGFHGINEGHSIFAAAARAAGFRMEQRHFTEITEDDLAGVDIFWLAIPNFLLLDEHKSALRSFMQNGGGLLIMTYPGYADLSNIDSFIRDYGMWFGARIDSLGIVNVLSNSPLAGPNPCSILGEVHGATRLVLNTNIAEAAAKNANNYTIAAISTSNNIGAGRLVVISSDAFFHNEVVNNYDNRNFGLNVLTYLSGGCDLRVTLCKAKRMGGKVKIIAKVRNVGTSASEATTVRFFLSTSNTYPVNPAGVAGTLGSVGLPALTPGKSKKVKVKLNIPGWVTPGDYYVIAVADPEGDTSDTNTDNNYKASKKKITIN